MVTSWRLPLTIAMTEPVLVGPSVAARDIPVLVQLFLGGGVGSFVFVLDVDRSNMLPSQSGSILWPDWLRLRSWRGSKS